MKHISVLVPLGDPQIVSIVGAYKAFGRANKYFAEHDRQPLFTVQLVGNAREHKVDKGVFSIHPHVLFNEVKHTDLVIIPAINWDFPEVLAANRDMMDWVTRQYKNGAEVASMCTGAFLLADTGLLNGRSCSTHWLAAHIFRRMFPDVNLIVEKLITDEYGIYTNGGAFSFLHLLLYLIEKYYGRETAIYCAKFLEVDIDRSSQSAFMMFMGMKDHQDEKIKKAQSFIESNVDKKISIGELADSLAIGRRNFDRRFIKATSTTPVDYLQRVKIEFAKKSLESSRKTVNEVMYDVGYSDQKAFREVFKRITGLSPVEYRSKYNKEALVI
ncbi:MAG: helix-turn-helix domain-containing protein [Bacteroidetes bacterium]|nr:helix-turn-helix domain-containing protein [Bacteroidota bacterium]